MMNYEIQTEKLDRVNKILKNKGFDMNKVYYSLTSTFLFNYKKNKIYYNTKDYTDCEYKSVGSYRVADNGWKEIVKNANSEDVIGICFLLKEDALYNSYELKYDEMCVDKKTIRCCLIK